MAWCSSHGKHRVNVDRHHPQSSRIRTRAPLASSARHPHSPVETTPSPATAAAVAPSFTLAVTRPLTRTDTVRPSRSNVQAPGVVPGGPMITACFASAAAGHVSLSITQTVHAPLVCRERERYPDARSAHSGALRFWRQFGNGSGGWRKEKPLNRPNQATTHVRGNRSARLGWRNPRRPSSRAFQDRGWIDANYVTCSATKRKTHDALWFASFGRLGGSHRRSCGSSESRRARGDCVPAAGRGVGSVPRDRFRSGRRPSDARCSRGTGADHLSLVHGTDRGGRSALS